MNVFDDSFKFYLLRYVMQEINKQENIRDGNYRQKINTKSRNIYTGFNIPDGGKQL